MDKIKCFLSLCNTPVYERMLCGGAVAGRQLKRRQEKSRFLPRSGLNVLKIN
jgi:hypothetical protein